MMAVVVVPASLGCILLLVIMQSPYTMSAIQTCSTYEASPVVKHKTTYTVSYYSCGYMGWSVCQQNTSTTTTYTIYVAIKDCCKGYAGSNCTAYCSNDCLYNSECSSPETCTCIEGWEGDDCLTDINECLTDTDQCEYHDTCINDEGSYSCSCPDTNQVIANDGHRCLESIAGLVLKPGKRTVKFEVNIPDSFYDDGEFEGFNAGCISEYDYTSDVFYGNDSSVDLTGLKPFTSYNCCIQPRWTLNGQGPKTCGEVTTLQDAPDDPPSNVTVETINERSVLVKWSPPGIPNGIIDNFNLYINYTNNTPIHLITISPVFTFFLHEYLKPHQTVIMSISAMTVGGEGPQSIHQSTTTYQDEPGAVDDLVVDVLAPYAVNVSWHPPEELNGIILQYYINVTKETPTNLMGLYYYEELEPQEEFYIIFNDLESYVPYTVSIAAATTIGLGEIYPVTFFTSQNTPSTSPMISAVNLRTPFSITVSWQPLMLWQLRGFLLHYQLTISESINKHCNETSSDRALNTTVTAVSVDISPFKNYCMSVSASTPIGEGEKSKFWYLQEQETSALEVHLIGVADCQVWMHSNKDSKLYTSLEEFAKAIDSYCDCNMDVSYFNQAQFICTEIDVNRVIVQAIIVGVANADSSTMVEYLQRWANTAPMVIVSGIRLTVDGNCPVGQVIVPSEATNTSCIDIAEPTTERIEGTSAALDSTEIISIVLGIGLGISVLVIIILLTMIFYNNIKSRKSSTAINKTNVVLFANDGVDIDDDDDNDERILLPGKSNNAGEGDHSTSELEGLTFTSMKDGDTLY